MREKASNKKKGTVRLERVLGISIRGIRGIRGFRVIDLQSSLERADVVSGMAWSASGRR